MSVKTVFWRCRKYHLWFSRSRRSRLGIITDDCAGQFNSLLDIRKVVRVDYAFAIPRIRSHLQIFQMLWRRGLLDSLVDPHRNVLVASAASCMKEPMSRLTAERSYQKRLRTAMLLSDKDLIKNWQMDVALHQSAKSELDSLLPFYPFLACILLIYPPLVYFLSILLLQYLRCLKQLCDVRYSLPVALP